MIQYRMSWQFVHDNIRKSCHILISVNTRFANSTRIAHRYTGEHHACLAMKGDEFERIRFQTIGDCSAVAYTGWVDRSPPRLLG